MNFLVILPTHARRAGAVDARALAALKAEVAARRVGGLVVGWPVDPTGRADTPECRRTRVFLDQLRAGGVLAPAVLWDERGSTAAARAALRESSSSARRRAATTTARKDVVPHELRGRVDALAAVAILQSFLDHAAGVLAADGGGDGSDDGTGTAGVDTQPRGPLR
jgi:RNase H-fold protein (predicted Holliday junction resolvase)